MQAQSPPSSNRSDPCVYTESEANSFLGGRDDLILLIDAGVLVWVVVDWNFFCLPILDREEAALVRILSAANSPGPFAQAESRQDILLL